MRGYIHKSSEGAIRSCRAIGHGSVYDGDPGDSFGFGRAIPRKVESLEPGLYRASFTTVPIGRHKRSFCVTIGRKVKSASAEAARLRGLSANAKRRARTGSPGIKGYAEAEHASSARLDYLRSETESLAAWLETL